MPVKSLFTIKSYPKLLNQLKSVFVEGLRIIEEQRVKTYWQTGELISKYLLKSKQHGDGLFIRLSKDLGINQRTLEQSAQFYRIFPIANTCSQLDWSHCRLLITVEDSKRRNFFKSQTIKNNWNVRQLQEAIRIERLKLQDLSRKEKPTSPPKLSLTRGRLYSYKLLKSDYLNLEQSDLLVDCGFSVWREVSLKGLSNPKEGEIVESISAKGGSANPCGGKTEQGFKFKYSSAKKNQLYTYKAFVEKVTDADTIWVHIDLGFYSHTRQKLRFRKIDAPEISTKKGQRAKEFVESTLSKVSFIIIRSTSLDKYGRPLTDVFYLEGENDPQVVLEKGKFLNQELLDEGLATLV